MHKQPSTNVDASTQPYDFFFLDFLNAKKKEKKKVYKVPWEEKKSSKA